MKLLRFVIAATRHALSGFRKVDFKTYLSRLRKCNDCPLRKFGTCTKCGCHVPTKAKWASEKCPINEWGVMKGPTFRERLHQLMVSVYSRFSLLDNCVTLACAGLVTVLLPDTLIGALARTATLLFLIVSIPYAVWCSKHAK